MFVQEDLPWYAEHFRAIAWDQRGLGESGQAAKYSLPLYAADLAKLLDHLEVEQAVVFGVSWGGYLVQRFALDYPERLRGARDRLLVERESTRRVRRTGTSAANSPASGRRPSRGRASKRRSRGHRALDASNAPEVAPEHVDSFVAQARTIAGTREHPLTGELHRIACPTLVVGGGNDVVAGAGGSVVLGRNIPGARTEIVQDAGHGVYRDKRETFRPLLLEFLADNGLLSE